MLLIKLFRKTQLRNSDLTDKEKRVKGPGAQGHTSLPSNVNSAAIRLALRVNLRFVLLFCQDKIPLKLCGLLASYLICTTNAITAKSDIICDRFKNGQFFVYKVYKGVRNLSYWC